MIQSQTVTPPLAAMLGTTLRLKTATTNSSTRSKRPRTRFRCGWLSWVVDNIAPAANALRVDGRAVLARSSPHRTGETPVTPRHLMCCDRSHALVLRHCQRLGNIRKCRQVLVDISLGMLHGNRPLLIPPVRLAHHAAIHHAKPVMTPQVDVDRKPVAVVTNLPRIQHQRTIRPRTRDVSLQANFSNGLLISIYKLVTKLLDMRIVSASKHFAESCNPRRHRNRIRVVSAAVKNLVIRDQTHHPLVRAESRQRKSTANRLRQAD